MGEVPRMYKLSDCPEVRNRLCDKATHGPSEAELRGCLHWLSAV